MCLGRPAIKKGVSSAWISVIRFIGKPLECNHLSGSAFKGSLGCCSADLIGFGNIGSAGQVAGASLESGQLNGTHAGIHILRDFIAQIACCTGQISVAEGVDKCSIIGKLTDIPAVRKLYTFTDCHNNRLFVFLHRFNFGQESIHMERKLRQTDQINAFAVFPSGQRGGRGQPARIAAHDFHHGHKPIAVYRGITDQFLHDHANVLCRRSVAGCMVCQHQIVIDGLGHTHETNITAHHSAILMQLIDGIHTVISTDIEKPANIQFLQNGEQLLIYLRIVRDIRQLVTAASKIGRRRTFQQFNFQRGCDLFCQIHHFFFEQTLNSVGHAVHCFCTARFTGFQNTGKACIDHRSRSTALTYDCIASHLKNLPESLFSRCPSGLNVSMCKFY